MNREQQSNAGTRGWLAAASMLALTGLMTGCGGGSASDGGSSSGGTSDGTTSGVTGGGTGGTTGGSTGGTGSTPFNGTYSISGVRGFVSFFKGGQYLIGLHDSTLGCTKNNGAGVVAGSYSWTPASGSTTQGAVAYSKATVDTVDVSGGTGADSDCTPAGGTGNLTINSDGSLSISDTDGKNPHTLTPVDPTATNDVLGAFVTSQTSTPSGTELQIGNSDGANSVLIFIDSSHYFLSITDPNGPGIEDDCYSVSGKTYSFDASSGCVVSTSSGLTGVDTSGSDTGASSTSFDITVKDANTLDITDSAGSLTVSLTRIPFAN